MGQNQKFEKLVSQNIMVFLIV